jgi:tRNA threonylcarbamoyl adenosine modification protein (Sua5/YciO/YrdC/YwlC family)
LTSSQILSSLEEASALLLDGKIGVIPTDTVYGLVVCANKPEAVDRLFSEVKPRDKKPGTIIASSIDQLVELGLKRRYLTAVEQYWPGAISIEIPISDGLEYLHRGHQFLAVRIPDDDKLRGLLDNTGPLMTTSANSPGEPVALNIEQAIDEFKDKVDFYVDGGSLKDKLPSTVIRINDDAIEVLRSGAVKINEATGRIED